MRGDFDALLPLRKHESACVIFDEVDAKEAWPETFHEAILEIERKSLWEMTGQVSHLGNCSIHRQRLHRARQPRGARQAK